jgi:hypothetical protein
MLELPPPPDKARRELTRERARRHRQLKKLGKVAYRVKAHEERLAEALRKSGMTLEESWDRNKVEAALAGLVAEWVLLKLRE